jgi:hypothetical protein
MVGGLVVAFGFLLLGAGVGWLTLRQDPGLAFAIWVFGAWLGAVFFLSGLGLGLARAKGWGAGGPVAHEGARIVAVMRLNARQEPVWNEGVYPDSEVRTYVRLTVPDGFSFEVETDPALLYGLGEGMKGTATTVGDRLLAFVPDPPEEPMACREGFRPDV